MSIKELVLKKTSESKNNLGVYALLVIGAVVYLGVLSFLFTEIYNWLSPKTMHMGQGLVMVLCLHFICIYLTADIDKE